MCLYIYKIIFIYFIKSKSEVSITKKLNELGDSK